MTSDAKIGLLLGLVFIFIIAFIINGLPSLNRESSDGNSLSIQDMNVPVNPQGLRLIQQELDSQELASEEPAEEPAVSEFGDEPAEQDRFAIPVQLEETEEEQTAQEQTLAASEEPFMPDFHMEQYTEEVESGSIRESVFANRVEPAMPEAVEPQIPSTVRIEVDTMDATPAEPQPIPEPAPAPVPKPTVHIVASGETLASIAKTHYGPERGNVRANIQKIFEANSDELESPDTIKVGQKLEIPPLPRTQTASTQNRIPSLLERIRSSRGESSSTATSSSTPTRVYTVKEGEDLWKIAKNELGKGSRYREIAKLNADTLPDPDKIKIGTRLRLPVE